MGLKFRCCLLDFSSRKLVKMEKCEAYNVRLSLLFHHVQDIKYGLFFSDEKNPKRHASCLLVFFRFSTAKAQTRLYSFKFSCSMVSLTAAKTNRMFSVSVAQVKCE